MQHFFAALCFWNVAHFANKRAEHFFFKQDKEIAAFPLVLLNVESGERVNDNVVLGKQIYEQRRKILLLKYFLRFVQLNALQLKFALLVG